VRGLSLRVFLSQRYRPLSMTLNHRYHQQLRQQWQPEKAFLPFAVLWACPNPRVLLLHAVRCTMQTVLVLPHRQSFQQAMCVFLTTIMIVLEHLFFLSFDFLCMSKPSSERVCQGLRFFFFMKFVLLEKTKQESHWLWLFKRQLQRSSSLSPRRNHSHQPHTVT
jgi:hypothetical protein